MLKDKTPLQKVQLNKNMFCPECASYMTEVTDGGVLQAEGWRKCPTCGYMHDRNGENKLTKRSQAIEVRSAESLLTA